MANRTGTYIAFDGLGEAVPTKSDFRYYSTIQGWDSLANIDFKFVNSHDKTYAVKDTSSLVTLKSRIRERLAASKQLVVILSPDTRKSGSLLSYEIEQAVDNYDLPLICVYTGYKSIYNPEYFSDRWPRSLENRLNDGSATAIHIPFKKGAIFDAINRFSVNGETLSGSMNYYSKEAHVSLGCIEG